MLKHGCGCCWQVATEEVVAVKSKWEKRKKQRQRGGEERDEAWMSVDEEGGCVMMSVMERW